MRRLVLLLLILAIATVPACSSSADDDTTTTITTAAPTTTTGAPSDAGVVVYLMYEGTDADPGPFIAPVHRPEAAGLEEALESLMRGITFTDSANGLSTSIPAGTRYLGVEVSGGVATVDLSREFESGGGSLSMISRVAQVVFTVTRIDGIDAVLFAIEGQPLTVLGGEGILLDEPQARAGYLDLLPEIWIDAPARGEPLSLPATSTGVARATEGEFDWALIDANGLILADGVAACGVGTYAPFEFVIPAGVSPGPASLLVYELAAGGSQQHALEHPVDVAGS
jgi:hypothetical protein